MSRLFAGLMSGTSLDGVDGVLVEFGPPAQMRVIAHAHAGFEAALADALLALNASGHDEIHRAALAANALVRCYAGVVEALLKLARVDRRDVVAVGAHGQTVRHRPLEFDSVGYTVQINNPALLAELCGIDVICDFRPRDLAAGGQGAPLVPAFHRAVFGRPGKGCAVLNIGGISNLTALQADGMTIGFDCGPGNALMDLWTARHRGMPYDADGRWAASGAIAQTLLGALQSEPYFLQPPPKSTGRDLFNRDWLDAMLAAQLPQPTAQDVQCTLAELTAWACAQAVSQHAGGAGQVWVCGGGARNRHLMARLAAHLPGMSVRASDDAGLPAEQVEAAAFAWLAKAFVDRQPGNVPSVTGARGERILGALYPAR